MNTLTIVGGDFGQQGGKASYLVSQLAEHLEPEYLLNGGKLEDLHDFIKKTPLDTSVLIWMPNIDNREEKLLPDIKKLHPKLFLIQSKRVVERNYDDFEIIKRLLNSHANLAIKITKTQNYEFSLLDPLGNSWLKKGSISSLAKVLKGRLAQIQPLSRRNSQQIGPARRFEIEPDFLEVVRDLGQTFGTLVRAVNPNRFLGNASTRCMHGFPSQRSGDSFFVSKRNVDKTIISSEQFVEVKLGEAVEFFGDNKPSVDTPIQLQLYQHYRNINYIVHGHVYVKDAPFTTSVIPCGYLEEAEDIKRVITEQEASKFAVNMLGHGCVIAGSHISDLKEFEFVARPFPEEFLLRD